MHHCRMSTARTTSRKALLGCFRLSCDPSLLLPAFVQLIRPRAIGYRRSIMLGPRSVQESPSATPKPKLGCLEDFRNQTLTMLALRVLLKWAAMHVSTHDVKAVGLRRGRFGYSRRTRPNLKHHNRGPLPKYICQLCVRLCLHKKQLCRRYADFSSSHPARPCVEFRRLLRLNPKP